MKSHKFYPDQVVRKLDGELIQSLDKTQQTVLLIALVRARKAGRVIHVIDGKVHIGERRAPCCVLSSA